jgi:hypothetical protein
MRPIYDNTVIQIDITNACHLNCANCTRFVGNHRKPYFMDLDTVERAIRSLDGFPGRIGIMGGEPALHPQFREILALMRELVPKDKREFWTAGFKWAEYKDDIHETFDEDRIAFNDHTQETGRHQPLLVAIEEVVEDADLRAILIENCPFQARWSASITPKGAFFCEIAAAQDYLFEGPGGYDVVPGWWKKDPSEFQDQVNEYCGKCSGALPLPTFSDARGGRDGPSRDVVSHGNLARLVHVGSPKAKAGNYEIWDTPISADDLPDDWDPREFRDFVAHNPEDVEEAVALL